VKNRDIRYATNVFVYELTTTASAAAETRIDALCTAILTRRTIANFVVWTVAATIEQGTWFRELAWVRPGGRSGR
jgi:hypothetical protein